MYITFDPDREAQPCRIHQDSIPTLKDLQAAVGGLIEPIDLWEDEDGYVTVWFNEEGLFLCDPAVWLITEVFPGHAIRGPIVVTRSSHRTTETVALTLDDVKRFNDSFAQIFAVTSAGFLPVLEIK